MNHYFEYGGGLGDIFYQMFSGNSYAVLNEMQPSDRATVVLVTHNPHARELFDHHPKAHQIVVRDLGYWPPEQDSKMRAKHALPSEKPPLPSSHHLLEFFPTPDDLALLSDLPARSYVVFSVSAGLPGRDIPAGPIKELVRRTLDSSLLPVFVGRNYARMGRKEFRPGRERGLDLVDCLTVPGVVRAVQNAAAVVCCHSAINILAWLLRKPQLLLYPPSVYERHISRRDLWAFGADFPECRHAVFDDPTVPRLAEEVFLCASHSASRRAPMDGSNHRKKVTPMNVKNISLPSTSQKFVVDETVSRLTPIQEVKYLCWLAQQTRGNVVEIGCNKGLTTRDLAVANPGKIIYAVDYFGDDYVLPQEQQGERPALTEFCVHARGLPNVVCIHAKPAEVNYEALKSVRLILVDGDHSYDGVKADTERAIAHLRSHTGGIVIWHDYFDEAPPWVGVKRYVDSLDLTVEHIEGTWLAVSKIKGARNVP